MNWRAVDVWRPGNRLRRYRCAECLDRTAFVVVTMDFGDVDDSSVHRAAQDRYYLEQLAQVESLDTADSLDAAIRQHDAAFGNE